MSSAARQATLQNQATLSDVVKKIPIIGKTLSSLLSLDDSSLSTKTYLGVRPRATDWC